ncbi:Transposase [Phytophthora palmivora]|uniref:Transposase n=1 Tax=Phytophthora palmivora TaxID=4796 RepID=A0A2P4YMV7_9STRA|nr:Transposase [Phytophthora palmivora]
MQGVDRLDQIRGRFSTADGHSFKKWFKKLGLALVDVARANAFLTRKLALGLGSDRDPHRDFIVQLVTELFNGKWKGAPSEQNMLFTDGGSLGATQSQQPVSAVWTLGDDGVVDASASAKTAKSPIFAFYTAWRCAKLSTQKASQRPSCVRTCLGHAGTNIIGFTCQGIYSQAKVRFARARIFTN